MATEIYPKFIPYDSEQEAQERVAILNQILSSTWTDGTTNNYDTPKKDINGKWWVICEEETRALFSEKEILQAKSYDQIEFI